MQCPRCQQDNPPHAKFCLECSAPFRRLEGSALPAPSYADVQRSLTEAIEQQTATSEIWRVISSSPPDTPPVFDTIAANAARLCSANDAQVLRVEGELLRLVAAFGAPSMPSVRRLTRGHLVGRAVIESRARTRCLLRGLRDLG